MDSLAFPLARAAVVRRERCRKDDNRGGIKARCCEDARPSHRAHLTKPAGRKRHPQSTVSDDVIFAGNAAFLLTDIVGGYSCQRSRSVE